MKRKTGAPQLSNELRSRVRAHAAQAASDRQAAEAIFAALAEADIDASRLSLDQWKTIVVDALRGARCQSSRCAA